MARGSAAARESWGMSGQRSAVSALCAVVGNELWRGGQVEQGVVEEGRANGLLTRQIGQTKPTKGECGIRLGAGVVARLVAQPRGVVRARRDEEVEAKLMRIAPGRRVEEVLHHPEQPPDLRPLAQRQLLAQLAAQRDLGGLHQLDTPAGQRPEILTRIA